MATTNAIAKGAAMIASQHQKETFAAFAITAISHARIFKRSKLEGGSSHRDPLGRSPLLVGLDDLTHPTIE